MIEPMLRPRMQSMFDAMARPMMRIISPNTMTMISLILGMACAMMLLFSNPMVAVCCMWASGLCDILDGSLARMMKCKTYLGAYLDLICDRVVEGTIVMAMAAYLPILYMPCMFFIVALMLHYSSYITASALMKNSGNKSMHHEYSMIERFEAFMFFSAAILMPQYAYTIMMSLCVLMVLDSCTRMYRAGRLMTNEPMQS